jgi:quinol monooxygenase YgiN
MIHVLATIELHPGQRDAFLREFHALMPLVHAEPGCLEYGPAVNCPTNIPVQNHLGEDTVTIIEKWADVPALEAHLKAPHMADYRVKVKPFVKGVTLRVLQPA